MTQERKPKPFSAFVISAVAVTSAIISGYDIGPNPLVNIASFISWIFTILLIFLAIAHGKMVNDYVDTGKEPEIMPLYLPAFMYLAFSLVIVSAGFYVQGTLTFIPAVISLLFVHSAKKYKQKGINAYHNSHR